MSTFVDRQDAGQRLAEAVEKLGLADPVVLALPRGGVPVAAVLAERLKALLDVLLARKIGAPGEPEFAIGAVVDGPAPATVFHRETIDRLAISPEYIDAEVTRQLSTIADRRRLYLDEDEPADLTGKDVVIVDDGIATGATIEAAMKAVRQSTARQVVLAVPVAPAKTIERLRSVADQIVCLSAPQLFGAVGAHYADFRQVDDDEVKRLLRQARS